MMKQLATAASKATKRSDEIKSLMFSTSELLSVNSKGSHFVPSTDVLKQSVYLPCKSPSGQPMLCSPDESSLIVDSESYANKFGRELILLDFTYEELNSLHALF